MGPKTLFFLFFGFAVCASDDEHYLATDKMTTLVQTEKDMLDLFSTYVDAEEEHLKQLKNTLLILKILYAVEYSDQETSNPLLAYRLMTRVRTEWAVIFKYTVKSYYQKYQDYLEYEFLEVPHQEDLEGAALEILTLQEFYKLYPQNITKDPETGLSILTADDAYLFGKVAYEQEMYQHAFLWYYQSLTLVNKWSSVTKQQLLRLLGLSAYHYGNLPFAIYFTQKFLNQDPANEEARLNLVYLKKLRFTHLFNPDIMTLPNNSNTYEALCRGETTQKVSRKQRQLSCTYSTGGGNPRLMYAPVKVEEVWDDPPIVRYHDIVSEKEMELLKNLSRPMLTRSEVYDEDETKSTFSQTRVSQSTRLTEEDDPAVNQINQRLSDITGLDMESSESLEVTNYGISGKFGPHYDAAVPELRRIATIVTYLSDVQIGGATVFPKIGVSVKPEKGSAVMWYNLLRNGQVDELSQHAGCPIFQGSKWIATKWVYEDGQEFIRPCSLSQEA